jgi:hypothetical protein
MNEMKRREEEARERSGLAQKARLDRRLEANLHPVTKVYCDENGLVCYERRDAEPITLGPGTPGSSRRDALRRARALEREKDHAARRDGDDLLWRLPNSQTGYGLSSLELLAQTVAAVKRSRQVEGGLVGEIGRSHGIGV